MAPSAAATLLSPAELSYLHASLSQTPPVRPDGRSPTQFRPLIAETDILPGTNGSARICFADGTEALVGVKAEVEKTLSKAQAIKLETSQDEADTDMGEAGNPTLNRKRKGDRSWIDMSIEIPGYRDDDTLPVFLSAMLTEALTATGDLADKLYINDRFHWRLYLDVLLLSAPLSYPVPLLSLTAHLALLSTHLPLLISEGQEDPMFSDDWDRAPAMFPTNGLSRPPITLLVVAVGSSVIFDPSKEEIAVADAILGISLTCIAAKGDSDRLSVVGIRTIDPPARTTTPGISDAMNTATQSAPEAESKQVTTSGHARSEEGVWNPPRGGFKRTLISKAVAMSLGDNGVGEEVLAGLENLLSNNP